MGDARLGNNPLGLNGLHGPVTRAPSAGHIPEINCKAGFGTKNGLAESDPKPLAPAPSVLANLNGQIAVLFHFSDKPTNQALTTLSVDILTAAGRLCGRVWRSAR